MNVSELLGFLRGMRESGFGQVKIALFDPDDHDRLLWVKEAKFHHNPGSDPDHDPGYLYLEVSEDPDE